VNALLQDEQHTKAAFLLHRIHVAALIICVKDLAQSARQLEIEVEAGVALELNRIFAKHLDAAVQSIFPHIPPHQTAAKLQRYNPTVGQL
jgi:HPt (histidine-containing phosphotransfer) domain-containing protein